MLVSAETIATLACNDHALKAKIEKLQERVEKLERQSKQRRSEGDKPKYVVGDLLTWNDRFNVEVSKIVRGDYYELTLKYTDWYEAHEHGDGETFYQPISEIDNDEEITIITPAKEKE